MKLITGILKLSQILPGRNRNPSIMKINEVIITLFIVVLLIITGWVWISPGGLRYAPDVSFNTIDGRQLDIKSLRGKPLLVTFWATTCTGCLKELPHLIELYHALAPAGFEIIGVAMAYDPPSQVVEMTTRKQIPYPIALDIDSSIADAFGNVMLTPTSFLIDPDGKIIQHKIGEMNMEKLNLQIRKLIDDQPAS